MVSDVVMLTNLSELLVYFSITLLDVGKRLSNSMLNIAEGTYFSHVSPSELHLTGIESHDVLIREIFCQSIQRQ